MPGIQTTIINKNSGVTEIHGSKQKNEKPNIQGKADSVSTPPQPSPSDKSLEPKETIES